ncbi:hypothetical protein Psyaliredsea_11630 [Psychrobacter alimentarius]
MVDGQTRNVVTDIDVILSNPEQDMGSLDLGNMSSQSAGTSGQIRDGL